MGPFRFLCARMAATRQAGTGPSPAQIAPLFARGVTQSACGITIQSTTYTRMPGKAAEQTETTA